MSQPITVAARRLQVGDVIVSTETPARNRVVSPPAIRGGGTATITLNQGHGDFPRLVNADRLFQVKRTAYPTNATFLAHTAHQDRGRKDDACRLCAVHGATRVTWATFVAEFPEWATA
jgi:hypothetical protein